MVTIHAESAPAARSSGAAFPATIELPGGLIGFPELTRFDVFPADEQGPFLWMRPRREGDPMEGFLVLDPSGLIADYHLELFDEDAESLGMQGGTHPWVLNIVTLHPDAPEQATVNLLGPVIVRRDDGTGRQVILANHQRYSATQPLVGGRSN